MKKISIFIQLVCIMFVLSAIPAITVIYVNSVNMRKSAENAIAEAALNKIRTNKQLSDEMLTSIIYDALDLVLAKQYYDLDGITSYDALNSEFQYVNAVVKMMNNLTDLSNRNKLVHSIFYYMDNADYVISTNGGFVKLEDYDNLEWLEAAIPKIRGAEGVWYPRRSTVVQKGERKTVDLVSYLYRSSSLYTSAKVTIVVNVYEEEISKMIYSDFRDSAGEGFLINSHGDVIAHSNPQHLYSNISSIEYVNDILQLKKKDGYGITTKEDFLYTYEKSDLYDWIYVNAYSLDQLYEQTEQITKTGVGMTIIIILIGAVCAMLFSMKISRPIQKLTDMVRGLNHQTDIKSKTRNEIVYLSSVFGDIQEREKSLKDSLSESEESIRHVAINNLIHDVSLREKERKLLEAYFPYDHFIICIISMDDFINYQKVTSHEERKYHRAIIYEEIRKAFPKEYQLDSIRYNVFSIALLLNFKIYDSDQVNFNIYSSLGQVQECYQRNTGNSLTIGISQVHNNFEGVKNCVDEANEASKKRLILGRGIVVFYEKSKNSDVNTYASYLHEKRIMNYLEINDIGKIEEELDVVVADLKSMEYISIDNIMMVFNQMIGSILVYLSGHNCNATAVFGGGQSNLYLMLTEIETIDEIKRFLLLIFTKIIEYQDVGMLAEDRDYAKAILQYIKLNYTKDIDFESLSRKIGISYSYARRIIKENTGKSLIDNLNEIRIEEAKVLLVKTDLTVAEVSLAVGYQNVQSLYRLFKKFEGLSPKDYCASISLLDEDGQ